MGADDGVGDRCQTGHEQALDRDATLTLAELIGDRRHRHRQADSGGRSASAARYLGFIGTLFLFVATASLFTIVPGYEPPTGSLSTTVALALCVFVAVPMFGIAESGLGDYLDAYLQPTVIMLPFNIISELSRTLALAVRLFGNMMSGTMILAILLTITPFIFPIAHECAGAADRHGAGLYLQHPGHGVYRRGDTYRQRRKASMPQ